MPETVVDPPLSSCYPPYPRPGIQETQHVGPDPFPPHTRDARGRFAKGNSGNPRGRPRGIPNPRRRVPNLAARPLSAPSLSDLIDRKPHLLRLLAAQLLPPPLARLDLAERIGIDWSSLRTVEDLRRVISTVLAAVARGDIAPAEAAHIAERADARIALNGKLVRSQRLAGSIAFVGEQAHATGTRATMTRDAGVGCRDGSLEQPLPPQLLHAGTDCPEIVGCPGP
jgi:Family of unknown function (DUF5681)